MKVFPPAVLPAIGHGASLGVGFDRPAPAAAPPAFVRAATAGGATPYLVSHVVEMLGRGQQRANALIETLATHGPSHVLGAALRAKPSLLDPAMMIALARTGSFREFESALALRPDLVDTELVVALRAGAPDARPASKYLAALFKLRPDLATPAAAVVPSSRTESAAGRAHLR